MNIVIDTPIWSEVFRRPNPKIEVKEEFTRILLDEQAVLIGPVRQELLSGIRDRAMFAALAQDLRAFPDVQMETADYELAASFSNICRAKGLQGSGTDFLLCAIANRLSASIFTLDSDFERYARHLPITLHAQGQKRDQ